MFRDGWVISKGDKPLSEDELNRVVKDVNDNEREETLFALSFAKPRLR